MQHRGPGAITLIVAFLLTAQPGWGQTDKRAAIPSAEAQAKATKLIKELFQPELAKAEKEPFTKAGLASYFLREARDTNDDPAGRFVLLNLASMFAAQGGDAATALQAIEEKAQFFALPAAEVLKAKIAALFQGSKSVSSSDSYQNMIDSAMLLLEDALAQDDYSSSQQLLEAAELSARKLRDVPLVASIRKRQDDVKAQLKAFARWQPFVDRLAKNPDDAEANLVVGLYQVASRGNWERGLPLLAKCNAPALKKLALYDLSERTDADGQLYLASNWFGLAEVELAEVKELKDAARIQMLLRSYHWYQLALGTAPTKEIDDIERMMYRITANLPAEYKVGEITTEIRKCDGHSGPVYCAAFSPDGKKIISAGADGYLRLWDVRTGKELRHIDGQSGRVWTVAFTPDGKRVVSGGYDGSVRLWDLASGREIRRFSGHSDYVRSVCVSRDGKHILSGGDDRLLRLWSIETGAEVRSFSGHQHFIWSVAMARDGSRGLSASLDKTVRVWDLRTGQELRTLRGHKDTVLSAVYAPGDRRALSGSTDKTMIVWNLEDAKEMVHLGPQKGYVLNVAVSPDGRRGLSAGQDHSVRIWDTRTANELGKLQGHTDQVWHVAFSADGRMALSCGQDGSLRIWGGQKHR